MGSIDSHSESAVNVVLRFLTRSRGHVSEGQNELHPVNLWCVSGGPPLRPQFREHLKTSLFRGSLGISEKAEQEFDRRSLGQKKRRHREKENRKCVRVKAALLDGPTLVNPCRSAAQRGRRQRELAKQIQGLLQTKSPENIRS
ncbi:hypothetical protein DFH09DRAFT_1093181 [Mycena vulgaris]|nr:hypothetical protein DFH09DRAFT_1093181 [Mycena vulgaris]